MPYNGVQSTAIDGAKATESPNIGSQTASATRSEDPFAGQRDGANDQYAVREDDPSSTSLEAVPATSQDRRQSTDEWDASKTPPSRFQKRKGSIYATPSSRDGHVDRNYGRDAAFHEKHLEKGYGK